MSTSSTDVTMASQTLMGINAQHGIRAVTVEGGYGIDGNGERFALEHIPRVTDQKRNDAGRCTSSTYQYTDGSVLIFKWSEQRGARYSLGESVAPAPVAAAPVGGSGEELERVKKPDPNRPHFR